MAERHGFHEAHFTSLPCQSNVYGLTCLAYPDGLGKVLVAPLEDKVVSLEYMLAGSERGKLKPIAKEIHFAGIPDDAKIIGIDSYQRESEDGGGHTIAITFTKDAETENPVHILNLYAPWEKGSEYVLDGIAQTWNHIELDFTPFYLCHTKIVENGEIEIVFLLTGSDKVHLYREDSGGRFSFSDHSVDTLFPEFQDLPCVALWLECRNLADSRRLSAIGCQSGYIRLSLVNTKKNVILEQWETHHDSAITCLRIFTSDTHVESAASWLHHRQRVIRNENGDYKDHEDCDGITDSDYSLLVTSALEVAVVYRNVLKEGFKQQLPLPKSDLFDCALCSRVADLDWDGQNEIMIGTYGQVLLVYKYIPHDPIQDDKVHKTISKVEEHEENDAEGITFTVSPNQRQKEGQGSSQDHKEGWESSQDYKEGQGSSQEQKEGQGSSQNNKEVQGANGNSRGDKDHRYGHYELLWSRNFATPLLALNHFDLTGDGLREIIVLSTRGLHILQHNLDKAAERCLEQLKQLVADMPT